MPEPYRGSAWRRWDLHIHTPDSYEHAFAGATREEQWDRYLTALAGLEDIAVLGITDYCSLAGFRRVKEIFDRDGLPKVEMVLPNIEFRLTEATEEGRSVNIHVIAAPEIVDDLPRVLLGKLRFTHRDEPYTCRPEDLIRFGRAYVGDDSLEDQAAFNAGARQFRVTREHLEQAFRESKLLRENAVIAVPNKSGDGTSGLREGGQRALRLEIYRMADVIISPNPADRLHFLGQDGKLTPTQVIEDYGGLKPCIGGSDAHRLEDIGNPAEGRHTWIKADPTFEGFLQICFEPEHRVLIGATPPNEPIHRIDTIRLRVPDQAELRGEEGTEPFCLRGDREIHFAPGLTCVIGGRGSGKSTLLSLLQEGAAGESEFFRRKEILDQDGTALDIGSLVELEVSSSPDAIEFLDQNQIEAFALDHHRLTQAVYRRLEKLDTAGALKRAADNLRRDLEVLERLQELIARRHAEEATLEELRGAEAAANRMIDSLNDENYTRLVVRAEEMNARLSAVRRARRRLNDLTMGLEDVLEAHLASESAAAVGAERAYESRTERLREHVREGITEARAGENLEDPSVTERDLQGQLTAVNEEISAYLADRGISPENLRDLSTATDRLAELREAITARGHEIARLREAEEDVERVPEARKRFEAALQELITPINERLRVDPDSELRRISIDYEFDTKAAADSCRAALVAAENQGSAGRQLREDHVLAVCSRVDWENFPADLPAFAANLRAQGGEGETVRRLTEYLARPGEFDRFRRLVEHRMADAIRFKRIEVRYDGKRLQQASFGQRCSAALIVLLMMGNQPMVIDEPEAHLDSALIANLLVDLIKDRKSERQIIFATHNANFVVNGDSEFIHILSVEGGDPTHMESTSLEDSGHRNQILHLEGGQDAFAQREKRYGFRGRFSRALPG